MVRKKSVGGTRLSHMALPAVRCRRRRSRLGTIAGPFGGLDEP